MWLFDWLFLSGGSAIQIKSIRAVNVRLSAPTVSGLTLFAGE